ncbi:MAG TPA: nitroreductase family protein [Kiritimatiellia bacterium]|jgi:nitroreductase|nr:nitroreductase family protein [Kiritimatiellia bacterium]
MKKSDFLELALKRRSVRAYKPDPVPPEMLQMLLEAGRWAPSAANKQPVRYIIVTEEDRRRALGTAYARTWFWQAPVILAVCILPNEAWVRSFDGQNYAAVDGALAMGNIQLAAAELGLGTCWIGAFDPAAVKQILNLPDGVEVVGLTPLGFPDVETHPRPRSRLPLNDLVMRERWQ